MIGRNEPCYCGSGKKYKKCCESKGKVSLEQVHFNELEQILLNFYKNYPERKDHQQFRTHVNGWNTSLNDYLGKELIDTIALDDFLFNKRSDIWDNYINKTYKKMIRPAILHLLEKWKRPTIFIGRVKEITEQFFKATCSVSGDTIFIRRESNNEISEGMLVFAFLLQDSISDSHYLASSTLIFFPENFEHAFQSFFHQFQSGEIQDVLKEDLLGLWVHLGQESDEEEENEIEFTPFELDVITQTKQFLDEHHIVSHQLIDIVKDYLISKKPNARKTEAIAAGAIRYGQERGLFEDKTFTIKDISQHFNISSSSLNKYYQELTQYNEVVI